MCGISGIIDLNLSLSKEVKVNYINSMGKDLISRGPDGLRHWYSDDDRVFLSFNWLSIQDFNKLSMQPYISDDKSHVLVFNGEIFNFLELKKKYLNNDVLKTKSDTEVLILLLIRYGINIVNEIEGMFSFVLYDVNNKKVFMVRDRFGIKPLYYKFDSNAIYFSSSFLSINKLNRSQNYIDSNSLVSFYVFGSVIGPSTMNKKIKEIPAGHIMEINKNTKLLKRYYSLYDSIKNNTLDSSSNSYEYFKKVIAKYLTSEAKKNIMLSSGIDSNIIYSLMKKQNTQTFTILFEGLGVLQRENFDKFNLNKNNKIFNISINDILNSLDEFFIKMDQPTIDGFNSFMITKKIKQYDHLQKVSISGLGLDELLGGYQLEKKIFISNILNTLSGFLRNNFFNDNFLKGLNRDTINLFFHRHKPEIKDYFFSRFITPHNKIVNFYDSSTITIAFEKIINDISDKLENINIYNDKSFNLNALNFEIYLKNQLLRDSDWTSMANSIEIRNPYLEHLFVEKMFKLNHEIKLNKKTFASYFNIDNKIINKKKTGFHTPIYDLLKDNVKINKYTSYQNKVMENFIENNF